MNLPETSTNPELPQGYRIEFDKNALPKANVYIGKVSFSIPYDRITRRWHPGFDANLFGAQNRKTGEVLEIVNWLNDKYPNGVNS